MPTFISLKRGHGKEPPKDIYMDVPCEAGEFQGRRRRISHFKYVESTNCDGMKMVVKMYEQQSANHTQPIDVLKQPPNSQTTVHIKNGEVYYSNDDVQFDHLLGKIMVDGKLNEDAYRECLRLISTGVVDIDRVCQYGRYEGDTILSVMVRLRQMDKVVELLKLGANAFARIESASRMPATAASLFWDVMAEDKKNPGMYYEAFTMIRKQAELQREEEDTPESPLRNDVYMCVEDNAEETDPEVLVYEDLLGRRDCSELYYTDEARLFQDEAEEVSEDSEDSNAEDYYDRICEAYGEEEDLSYGFGEEDSSYGGGEDDDPFDTRSRSSFDSFSSREENSWSDDD